MIPSSLTNHLRNSTQLSQKTSASDSIVESVHTSKAAESHSYAELAVTSQKVCVNSQVSLSTQTTAITGSLVSGSHRRTDVTCFCVSSGATTSTGIVPQQYTSSTQPVSSLQTLLNKQSSIN